ncbi:MAG: hypothetical protein ABJC09_04620 [Terriglobia bacterium]
MRSDNESWIIDAGSEVIEKKTRDGIASLSAQERLIYCLWVADYCMRNAGDFANVPVLYPDFQRDGVGFAAELSLPFTRECFSLAIEDLQQEYFERFERLCDEIKFTAPSAATIGNPYPVKIDSIYFAIFCFAQLYLFSALGRSFYPEFLWSWNSVVWAAICALAFGAYPWLQASFSGRRRVRFGPILAHAAALFALSTTVCFVFTGWIALDHFAEWQLGLFLIAVPSAVASVVALLLSYGVFQLTRSTSSATEAPDR